MEIFLIWLISSFVIASYGANRKIGFGLALIACLFLSPLIGAICVALSERNNNNDKTNKPPGETTTGFDIERYRAN